jgi:deaminated glutathione amidase
MRVAVVQFAASADKDRNRALLRDGVRAAADLGADLAVLPEAAMHPFGEPDESLAAVAEPLDGPFATELVAAAGKHGLTVVGGLFEPAPGEDRVFNTVLAAGPDGPLGHYRKLHLFDALGSVESAKVMPAPIEPGGPALLTFPVGGFTVGVLTCYDVRFPELARALVDRGASLLAVPAGWMAGPLKESHWQVLLRARAIENTCYVAAADQSPPICAGRSLIADPMGVVVAQVGEAAGIAVAEASPDRLAQVRQTLPSLSHRRFDVVPKVGPAPPGPGPEQLR